MVLNRPYIIEAIRELEAKIGNRAEEAFAITTDRVLQELAAMAFANLADFITVDPDTGRPSIDMSGMTRRQAAALTEASCIVNPKGGQTTKIKISDKKAALELLGRYLGMWNEKGAGDATTADKAIEALLAVVRSSERSAILPGASPQPQAPRRLDS